MTRTEFRKELKKIMPGYKWTVHHGYPDLITNHMIATGTQVVGTNRMSTLQVERTERGGKSIYMVRSSGFGGNAPWLANNSDITLPRALRGLQDIYENTAANFASHARALQAGRVSS